MAHFQIWYLNAGICCIRVKMKKPEVNQKNKKENSNPENTSQATSQSVPNTSSSRTTPNTPSVPPEPTTPPASPGGDFPSPVQQIRELLGPGAVLLPVTKGQKRPSINGWQNVTIAQMTEPAYLAQLERGNIGVLLGSASGGLCAIDIDGNDAVEPFLDLNPTFRKTLRTRGARGAQIWVQMTGEVQKLTKLKTTDGEDWGEWRADGAHSVIHGEHPSGVNYQILNLVPPVETSFDQIKWPENLLLPWVKTDAEIVTESEGPPLFFQEKGGLLVNQMYFVRKYILEHNILFHGSGGTFFQYDHTDGQYKQITVPSLKRVFLNDLAIAAKETQAQVFLKKRTDGFVQGLVGLLESAVEQVDPFEKRPRAIHVSNGMICFENESPKLKTFHPSFLSRNRCPYAYDPISECPRFVNELLRPAMSDDDVTLLQKWCGALLMGRNAGHKVMLLIGTAGGGKSTLMNIVERMIGLVNVSQLRTEQLGERFELSAFVGKTLLSGKDVSSDFLMQKGVHVLKALVGEDLMETERKNANERIQIRGDYNVGITCNADLNIRLQGDAPAWRRRLLVIRYENPPPPRRIPDFAEQLLATEGFGILRWMVDGAMDLLDDMRDHGNYSLSRAQTERIDRLMDQSESVRRFVQDGVVSRDNTTIATEDLITAYFEFCDARRWAPFPPRELRADLAKYMLEIHRVSIRHDIPREGRSVRGYKHVAVVTGGLE